VPGTDEDVENESFEIEDELLVQMADTPQDIINATATHQWVLTVTS
jgi:hypothetical protein